MFALYRKDKNLYILSVAFEDADSKFVGFNKKTNAFKVVKIDDQTKQAYKDNNLQNTAELINWLKVNNPEKYEEIKNYIFVGKGYCLSQVVLEPFPAGKPYTQLPGGGGVYKETRKYNTVNDLFKNGTILKAIENYGGFSEAYNRVRKMVKESVEKIVTTKKIKKPQVIAPQMSMFEEDGLTLKQENPKVAFTAVSIEGKSEKKKLDNVYKQLAKQGRLPEDFIRPQFKDGTSDYHMTITLGELPLGLKRDLNKKVTLNIVSVGISNDAIALGVSGDYFSKKDKQHITLAFKNLPNQSDEIDDWKELKTPLKINGIIREFDISKNIIVRGVFVSAYKIYRKI